MVRVSEPEKQTQPSGEYSGDIHQGNRYKPTAEIVRAAVTGPSKCQKEIQSTIYKVSNYGDNVT